MVEILSFIALLNLVRQQAMAFGYEVARQGKVSPMLDLSPDNPFVHDWRYIYGID